MRMTKEVEKQKQSADIKAVIAPDRAQERAIAQNIKFMAVAESTKSGISHCLNVRLKEFSAGCIKITGNFPVPDRKIPQEKWKSTGASKKGAIP